MRGWNLCAEDDLAPRFCRAVLTLYGGLALAPLEHGFGDDRVVLGDAQKAALREILGVARALRIVSGENHAVYSWGLIKDAYLREVVSGLPETFTDRAAIARGLPAAGRALVLFDTLSLKAAGGSSPECSALSLFIADLYERGAQVMGFSRLPLFSRKRAAEGMGARRGADDDLDAGLETMRDERGRLRVVRKRAESDGGLVSFESALDEGAFERLVQMVHECVRSLA